MGSDLDTGPLQPYVEAGSDVFLPRYGPGVLLTCDHLYMDTALDRAAFAEHLARETAAYAAVLDRTAAEPALLDLAVAACPDWDLRGLSHHLGGVHRWTRNAVVDGRAEVDMTGVPSDPAALARWFREGVADLMTALDGDPEREVWTFHPPHVLGFWQRRQANENLVHRWDAEAAVGESGLVGTALATDGIAEIFDVFLPRRIGKGLLAPLPRAVTLRATDSGRTWILGPGEPVAELAAPADVLLLRLWKRVSADDDRLVWDGSRAAGEQVLAMPLSS